MGVPHGVSDMLSLPCARFGGPQPSNRLTGSRTRHPIPCSRNPWKLSAERGLLVTVRLGRDSPILLVHLTLALQRNLVIGLD